MRPISIRTRQALLEKLLGKDYEVITADERLDKIAADFVEHCARAGSRQVHAGVHRQDHLRPHAPADRAAWKAKAASVRAEAEGKQAAIAAAPDDESRQSLHAQRDRLLAKAAWLDETIVEIIISEAQNEVADFRKWGFDIIPAPCPHEAGLRDAGRQACRRRIGLQEPAAPVPGRDRLRHVADGLRRGVPVNALHRQADEGAHPDAGHRPRQPASTRARTSA
jgi:type I restriction enzyme R subunit